jgi:hypothetical protein
MAEQPSKDWAKKIAAMEIPRATQARMQALMDRNNEGELTREERKELETLVEMSETFSLLRAKAMDFLRRRPQ